MTSSAHAYSERTFPTHVAVALACFCALVGLLTINSAVTALLAIWHTDDLRSMGLIVPLVSFALIFRSWRFIGWRSDGSWWGFAVIAASAAVMFLRDQTLLMITINKAWLLQIPPLPLLAICYTAGIVLLFGGMRLLHAAWFGVLFMGMVIPVPRIFTQIVDLPLQHVSATVARAFAHAFGQPLTQDKLRLMFTPEFGMFIAPGCNGIRGSVTLGLAAVVVSYLYRFRWSVYAPVVAGAVLLGYLFNFLRLCLLVIYYQIALPRPWLQQRARNADFLIGGALFLCALTVFFTVATHLRKDLVANQETPASATRTLRVPARPLLLRALSVCLLATIFGFDVHNVRVAEAKERAATPRSIGLPAQLGPYSLVRTWDDTNPDGRVVYRWGEYAIAEDSGPHVNLGLSPDLDTHDAEVCHFARGESPVFHGQLRVQSQGTRVNLTLASYNNGVGQWLEGATSCDGGVCREFSSTTDHVTVVYAGPHRGLPLAGSGTRTVPVLLRLNSQDVRTADPVMRPLLTARMKHFLESFDLSQVTRPYSTR